MRRWAVLVAMVVLAAGCMGGKGGKGDGTPVVDLQITPLPGEPNAFRFDATNSTDPQGQPLTVRWTFGDDNQLHMGPMYAKDGDSYGVIDKTYDVPNAVYHVGLVVEDPDGNRAATTREVTVGNAPNRPPNVLVGNSSRWVRPGTEITIDSSASVDEDDDLFNTEWIFGNWSATRPPEALIGAPMLQRGQSFNQTFNTLGYYDYHCHPHPWMRGRVIVSNTHANATVGTAAVEMTAYSFQPKVVVVQPGATVRWVNEDPVPHNVTIDHFSPGVLQGETTSSAVLSIRPPAGEYVANLILDDLKGGVAWQSFGIKVDPMGPEKFNVTYHNQSDVRTGTNAAVPAYSYAFPYKPLWPQNVSGAVAWTDPVGQSSFSIALHLKATGAKIMGCIVEDTSCSFAADVSPQEYEVRVAGAGTGVGVDLTIVLNAVQYTKPDFGDASSHGDHPHH